MTWDDVVRFINLIGCILSLYLLSSAAYRQWGTWNHRTKMHWLALVGWVVLGTEGTLESMIRDVEPGSRTILTTFVIAWTLRALLVEGKLESESLIPRKGTDK